MKIKTRISRLIFFSRRTFMISMGLLALVKLSACAADEKRTVTNAVGSVVSEEKFQEVAIGGVCTAPTGKTLSDIGVCGDLSSLTSVGIGKYLPSEVALEHVIKPAASGGGYVYRLFWKFTQPKALEKTTAKIDWKIYEDEKANLKPAIASWNEFLDSLTAHHLASDNPKEFVSQKLLPGRRYVYYLTSSIFSLDERQRSGVSAEVVHFRIVVDLRNALPKE